MAEQIFDRNGVVIQTVADPDPYAGLSPARARAVKQAALHAEYDRREAAGITIGGILVRADAEGLAEVDALAGFFARNPGEGTYQRVTPAGHRITLTSVGLGALQTGLEQFRKGLDANHARLFDEIEAAATVADIQAVNITTGWPE